MTVNGFDVWNGRIVATLSVPPRVDSLARIKETLIAGAMRTDSSAASVTGMCARDNVPEDVWLQAGFARDSVEQALRDASIRLPERLQNTLRVETSHAIGCFAHSRMLLVVTLVAGNYEYVRQGAVAVSDTGGVTPLAVLDPRFRAHVALHALDADGDGVDDVAVRGRAERMGATVVLRYNVVEKRLEGRRQRFGCANKRGALENREVARHRRRLPRVAAQRLLLESAPANRSSK